jgi:hypothetical protein
MPTKKPDADEALASDDTFESGPVSDEARLPQKGALKPEHPRDGTAEASDMHELAQRAVESGDDPEAPLDFEHPSRDRRDRKRR